MTDKAEKAAIGDFMPAAEHDGMDAPVQQFSDALAQAFLHGLKIAIRARDIAGVMDDGVAMDGQPPQHLPDGRRPLRGTGAAVIAADTFVAGEAENSCSALCIRCQGQQDVLDAQDGSVLALVAGKADIKAW